MLKILSIFRFKDDFLRVFSVDNIIDIVKFAKRAILSQDSADLTKGQKKKLVDELVSKAIANKVTTCTNPLVHLVAKRFIEATPKMTQTIYDCLKEKIKKD